MGAEIKLEGNLGGLENTIWTEYNTAYNELLLAHRDKGAFLRPMHYSERKDFSGEEHRSRLVLTQSYLAYISYSPEHYREEEYDSPMLSIVSGFQMNVRLSEDNNHIRKFLAKMGKDIYKEFSKCDLVTFQNINFSKGVLTVELNRYVGKSEYYGPYRFIGPLRFETPTEDEKLANYFVEVCRQFDKELQPYKVS